MLMKLYRAVRDTPVSLAMAVFETPSSRKRRILILHESGRYPDMRDQIVALFDRVMDVQTEVLTAQHRELKLTERCRKLEDDLRSVRDWQAEKARYTLTSLGGKTFVYAVKPDDPRGEPPHWLCVRCIEGGKKSVLQHWGVIYSNRRWKCPRCEAIISAAQELAP